ncbi:MAG: ribosome-binding factor A, partial [Adlercreutzia sp.]|nr:ribosome-binding factor A [Adlercreutzia sp.]
SGHIRSLMAKKLSWRVAPELRFYVDTSVDQAEAISQALNSEREHQEKRIEEETIGEDREY